MIFKSFIIEKNIKLLDTNSANIFYGENIGLKDDLKIQIKNLYEDYEILTLMQDEILKNHNILYEELNNLCKNLYNFKEIALK